MTDQADRQSLPDPPYSPEMDAHIWSDYRSVHEQLRCGVLLCLAGGIEQWAAQLLDLLKREPAVTLQAVFLLEATTGDEHGSGAGLFRRLEHWSSLTYAPFRRTEFHPPLDIPVVPVRTDAQTDLIRPEDRDRIIACNLDVLVWLDSRPPRLDSSGLARFGLWSLCFGDPDKPLGFPPYWHEVLKRRPVSTLALQQRTAAAGAVRNLARCETATQMAWRFTQNAVDPITLAGPVLMRRLRDVLQNADLFFSTLPEQTPRPGPQILPPPTNRNTAAFVVRQAARSVFVRVQVRRRTPSWFVAVRSQGRQFRAHRDTFLPDSFRDVPIPEGHGYADPFVVREGDRNWLFVEEMSKERPAGRLTCLELRADGGFGDPFVILEKPYHMSYPFVIREGSDFFLVPETSDNHTVDLYRATHFPFEWTLEKELCSRVAVVDTSPVFLDGKWYFFTTSSYPPVETFLFWSDRLDGKWHYHPRNPICSDVRRARGAGALFRSGGELIRPSQDCSLYYGYAIVLNRVIRISPTEYEEQPIETIYPNWRKGLLATHTLNSNDAFEAIDGLRYVL